MKFEKILVPFAGIDAGNWLMALVVAVVSFVVIHGAVILFRRRLCKLGEDGRADRPAAELLKATLARTSNLAVIVTSLLVGLTVLDLAPPWDERLRHLWFIALGAQLALYLDRAISVGAKRYFHRHAADPDAPSTVAHTLMVWAIKTMLWVMFALAMLSNLGINVSAFVASLGIGGIAVALAVQNILGDLFASLSIAVDKPFEVGDAISVAGFSGKVEHVGLKTTRIRADSGEQIVIANAELLKNTVRNFKRMSNRRVQFSLMADPSTPPALARKVPGVLRAIIERQPDVRFDRVHLKKVAQDALEFELVFFVLDAAYGKFMDTQQAILLEAMEAFEEMGVSSGGPAQHLVLERRDGEAGRAPAAFKPVAAALHTAR
ncbi:mechanosensitive ion channel family protein [Massilia sp. R2A-15]|uniref:mechanosensitive ion channel family protein n=1 Tax=Massilia sp. R2A-15 TaxID=3064278 RepID=UPI0027350A90|nr:mechanosensitive ion channel family protein [Massilia sp. R2A-15]WLI90229.1 mechanosensitive ion channel family protein [Massilia sp. R2A-15]